MIIRLESAMNHIMEDKIRKLKKEIIEVLNLEDVSPDDIDENAPLFGEGLGLDSIDILELIGLMKKYYDINIVNPDSGEKIFSSIRSMADYIDQNRNDRAGQ